METIGIIVALIIAGLVLILVEILTPMFGAIASLAIGSLVGAAWLTFTISPVGGIIVTVLLILLVPVYTYYLMKFLPSSPLGRRLFLSKAPDATAEGTPQAHTLESLIEGGMIEKGDEVKVIEATGTDLVVRRIDPS